MVRERLDLWHTDGMLQNGQSSLDQFETNALSQKCLSRTRAAVIYSHLVGEVRYHENQLYFGQVV